MESDPVWSEEDLEWLEEFASNCTELRYFKDGMVAHRYDNCAENLKSAHVKQIKERKRLFNQRRVRTNEWIEFSKKRKTAKT